MKIKNDYTKFRPKRYLNEYYKEIGPENEILLRFFSKTYKTLFKDLAYADVVELGGGPTIYQLISLSQYPVNIHFSDFSPQNLLEIKKWLEKHKNSFSWKKYFKHVHNLEKDFSQHTPSAREKHLRDKIIKLSSSDISKPNPLGPEHTTQFDIVSTHFVSESITDNHSDWERYFQNSTSLLKPNGHLVQSSIIESSKYKVGKRFFPSTAIQITDIHTLLTKNNFELLSEDFVPAEKPADQGYKGLHMFVAKKVASKT